MTSLADQIADRQTPSSPNAPTDEFGIPVPAPETPEYWVARALLIHNRDADLSVHCLHLRGTQLYLAHTPLKENEETLYRLARLRHPVKKWEVVAFYETLRGYLPRLDRRFLMVADDCFWDVERAELLSRDEVLSRSRPQSHLDAPGGDTIETEK